MTSEASNDLADLNELKATLHGYLRSGRESLMWKLEGLSDYDVRRPLVPTGTNLLGLVKHVSSVGVGYFGEVFDRPFPEPLPWFDDDAAPNADLYATADESREQMAQSESHGADFCLYRLVGCNTTCLPAATSC